MKIHYLKYFGMCNIYYIYIYLYIFRYFDYCLLQKVTVSIYDFSTLYTTIPHNLLVKDRSEVINFILNIFRFVLK